MSKVDDMTDREVQEAALRFHNTPATHPCEHGHPEHALAPGGPCILDHVERYIAMQCAGVMPLRSAIEHYFRIDHAQVYEVETRFSDDNWENVWHEDDGVRTFPTADAANQAIDEFFDDIKRAGLEGYEREDYRIVRK